MSELWRLGAAETARKVKAKEITAREAAEAALARMDAVNPAINAVVERFDDEALAAADAVDAAVARGEDAGALAGVPMTVKVNIDQKGHATTNGLKMLLDHEAEEDSPVVTNLRRAGAVIVGRTNTPAFSLRWFTRNSAHGWTKNPRNPALTPGGSSGGAAAATAAGIGAVGHGTDIAGSIRYPSYACGLHGIRPTLGRVAAWNPSTPDRHIGAQIMAVSGPIARSVEDVRLALGAMAARDPRDPWWVPAPLDQGAYPKRAALCVAPEGLETHPHVEAALRDAAARLVDAGWQVDEVACPPLREPMNLQVKLWLAETRRPAVDPVPQEADPDADYYYAKMQEICPAPDLNEVLDILQRRLTLAREWMLFFERYPLAILPVSAEPPFRDQRDMEPGEFEKIWEAQMTQIGLPLMGLPGASAYTGMTDGAPLGAQLIAGRYREDIILDAAAAIEARGPKLEIATP